MTAATAGTLPVPGARLYHEVVGSGPMLLLIPGGNGDTGPFERLAAALADRRTVVSYDRRGFSRSPLDEPPDPAGDAAGRDATNGSTTNGDATNGDATNGGATARRIDADVTDAVHLIDAFSGGRAAVLGSSSGAIVALHLLARHPGRITTLVAHEPPLFGLLPDGDAQFALLDEVHGACLRHGLPAAMELFAGAMGLGRRPRPAQPPGGASPDEATVAAMTRVAANQRFWMEHELRQYPRAVPDLAALRAATAGPGAPRLVLGGGAEGREYPPYRPNLVLGERLGLGVVEFPGAHVGYATHPAEFAARLDEVLAPHGG